MRLTKSRRSHAVVFNLTPLIDVVFLLIIFFMTVSQVTRIADEPLPLPVVPRGSEKGPAATMTINMDQQGQIFMAGKAFTLDRTMALVRERLREAKREKRRLEIELRCDRRCPSDHVNKMMVKFSGVGVNHIRIAVAQENQESGF